MIIDTHQHFWKYDPVRDTWIDESMSVIKRDFLPEHLAPVLRQNNVEACIAVQADQSENETAFLLGLAETNDFIKGVVGWVDLTADNVDERLAFFAEDKRLKGIRHILQAEANEYMLRTDFKQGIGKLASFGLVYDILISHSQLEASIRLVDAFPDQIFVMDHIAKPNIKEGEIDDWQKQINALAQRKNVYCKLSGLVTEANWTHWKYEDLIPYLNVVMDAFGPSRLLFGSDWPVCLLAGEYDEILGIVQKFISYLSVSEQADILAKNAIKVYQLNETI